MFKESKKRDSYVGEAREEFVGKYPPRVVKIVSAIEFCKNTKKLKEKDLNLEIKEMIEYFEKVIEDATDDEKIKAKEMIEASIKEP